MLRLPTFEYHEPKSLPEAVNLLKELEQADESVSLIAGGTDLLPNMKHEIVTPAHLVSLRQCGLSDIDVDDAQVTIGAMTSLDRIMQHPEINEILPALVDACAVIAGPQLRRMGTLGGNLCLDTRCLYINQSHFWRQSLGYCLKKDGTECHVVTGGKRCVAAAQNDSALPLMLYGAQVRLVGPDGERTVAVADLFVADGVNNKCLKAGEILTVVTIPRPAKGVTVAFEKLRMRQSIDFAMLNMAVLLERAQDGTAKRLQAVVGSLGARPKKISLDKRVAGKAFDDTMIEMAAAKCQASVRPLTNIAGDATWRQEMAAVLARRALAKL